MSEVRGPKLELYLGDCLSTCRLLSENSIDTVITDPPYGIGFMGKGWDNSVPGVEYWSEFLRLVKPGGILLAFGGTRTFHRLACAIEDSGWILRDTVMWVYGEGFPKSHDIAKAIDKSLGVKFKSVPAGGVGFMNDRDDGYNVTKNRLVLDGERSSASLEWDGYGTALKPAWEPIIVAMKPTDGTYAQNAIEYGVGGFNIDLCRVGGSGGRWPANLIHDGSEDVVSLFPVTGPSRRAERGKGIDGNTFKNRNGLESGVRGHNDSGGSAARFFYCAKPSKSEREGNDHPTVKPLSLVEYLCKLTRTPKAGVVLDPFMGSGTTGVAAARVGRDFIGIEINSEYFDIAKNRLNLVENSSVVQVLELG